MAYYLIKDDDGNETREEKNNRGRPRKGYEETSEGVWTYTGKSTQPKKKLQKHYVLFDEDGNYESHKKVSRGARPKHSVVVYEEGSELLLASGEEFPENFEIEDLTRVFSNDKMSYAEMISVSVSEDLDELIDQIEFDSSDEDDDYITLNAADCSQTSIEYFQNNPECHRLTFMLESNEIHLWKTTYNEGKPDVILKGAFVDNEKEVEV